MNGQLGVGGEDEVDRELKIPAGGNESVAASQRQRGVLRTKDENGDLKQSARKRQRERFHSDFPVILNQ